MKRYWPVFNIFKTQQGTRVWATKFEHTKQPLLIECVERNERTGDPIVPGLFILPYDQWKGFPEGQRESDNVLTRVVKFKDLEKVSPSVANNPVIRKARLDEQRRLLRKRNMP